MILQPSWEDLEVEGVAKNLLKYKYTVTAPKPIYMAHVF
jgi:hypothetical protein